jgi:paired amphipathic helix protein Sin3a
MRFALQPQIYKAFLEILHTYHKEQHTIKDVYEQVATLFQNHQDLLEEFAQFLPDPVASQNITAMPRQQQAPLAKAPKGRGGKVKAEKVVEPKERPPPRSQRQIKPPTATTPPLEERRT